MVIVNQKEKAKVAFNGLIRKYNNLKDKFEMNKNKEILELKKLYLMQIEKWESKFFFTILALSLSLIFLAIKGLMSYWWGIVLYLISTVILQPVFELWRTKKFNELKKEIETGKFEDMRIMPNKKLLKRV